MILEPSAVYHDNHNNLLMWYTQRVVTQSPKLEENNQQDLKYGMKLKSNSGKNNFNLVGFSISVVF